MVLGETTIGHMGKTVSLKMLQPEGAFISAGTGTEFTQG